MKEFSLLFLALESTNKTSKKIEAIRQFLQDAPDEDKRWFLALFTGKRPKRSVSTKSMRQWALELTDLPEWLLAESYAAVGDLGETISLILPPVENHVERNLSEWMELILQLHGREEAEKETFVKTSWLHLPHPERFIFNKLLGGSFRVGVSSKTLIQAIAQHYDLDANAVAHAIMGDWQIEKLSFDEVIRGLSTDTRLSRPYPFCLAYPLDRSWEDMGDLSDWQIEYKWDGIRGQLIHRQGEVFIWSRGAELVTAQFPELQKAMFEIPKDLVLDGELLVYQDGLVQNFSELQKRLNRKNISKKMLQELPVYAFVYDLLELDGVDLREKPLHERRALLEKIIGTHHPRIQLAPILEAEKWEDLAHWRESAREHNSEGLMLKHRNSTYHTGRKKGDWWKWKLEARSIDAVLIYAQKGSGRRSGFYTDYTFAVKDGDHLVTIAKAYSGLTDEEIKEVSRFVQKNALEKFGPVRTVRPELVFEIAFEGIGFSNRHKSGVALRFPRILRWRRDKKVEEIDELEEIKKMIR